MLFDRQGRCLTSNRPGFMMMKTPEGEVIGRSFAEIWPEEMHPVIYSNVAAVLAGNACFFEAWRMNGLEKGIWEVSLTPVYNEENLVDRFLAISMDVTERKRMEDALLEQQAQLAHAGRLSALGEMATAMAHEIHQPLTVMNITVQGWELLRDRGRLDPEKLVADIGLVRRSIERISNVIEQVRAMGRVQHDTRRAPLAVVVENALSLCRMQLQDRGIELYLNWGEDSCANIDIPMEVEQVLLNLFSNARYAVEERMAAGDEFEPGITVQCSSESGDVRIRVSDTGRGVPPESAGKIFDPFFTTKPAESGTGLGLSISMRIMSKFGGGIRLLYGEGPGACFELWLPRGGDIPPG